jgi:hypothetical protein
MARLNGDGFNLPYYDLKKYGRSIITTLSSTVSMILSVQEVLGCFCNFGLASIFIITPILTYKYGKALWYCSWVCGCGGLAERTAGIPLGNYQINPVCMEGRGAG